ncbi:MAG: hypothetical protein U5L45_01590 [Saprospiraceae bacterium]|nr:hypothetical protein [Saprospiraceae bacterium]
MVRFSGFARKTNHPSPFLRAKRAIKLISPLHLASLHNQFHQIFPSVSYL